MEEKRIPVSEKYSLSVKEAANYFSIGTKKMRNEIYQEQLPNIIPHVCWHTYCSNQAKAGMNHKTLQYLMGHSDIGVTMNVYTLLGLEDAAAEMTRMEEVESARKEQEKISGGGKDKEKLSRKMFRVV